MTGKFWACSLVIGVLSAPSLTVAAPRLLDVAEEVQVDDRGRFEVTLVTREDRSSMLSLDIFGSRVRGVRTFATKITGTKSNSVEGIAYRLPVEEFSASSLVDASTCLDVAIAEPDDIDFSSLPRLDELGIPDGILFRLIPLVREILAILDAQEPHLVPRCELVPQDKQDELTALLQELFLHHPWTAQDTCELFNSEYWDHIRAYIENELAFIPLASALTHTPLPRAALVNRSYRIAFIKDECETKRSRYVLTIRGRARAGSTVLMVAQERVRDEGISASLKPESEGKFAPEPLLLMETIGACGLSQWSYVFTRREVVRDQLSPADLITHDGKLYTRTPLGAYMDGRRASFFLASTSEVYGVCFRRHAVRQTANGYRLSSQ